ncbi:RNA-binding domain-containing protein [Treponema zioleckii]|uniref:RNA-binding domain-containing protein n=1 Tax=Treponema zioleckii TaxID=331680 RepID=UPI00168B5D9D|nr:RNA-binding domain-containing protein [Treponema zioleckii]
MTDKELLEIAACGETSRVQFKALLDNQASIAAEMVAMSNSKGGQIIFGIADKTGEICGLEYSQIQEIGNKLSSIATDLVKPQIFITTEVVSVFINADTKRVLVANIEEGIAKPYKDHQGIIWIKQGGDKRKLTDNNEQIRLFQQSGLIYVDEMIVPNTAFSDLNKEKICAYLSKIDGDEHSTEDVTEQICKNLNILKADKLTLGGLLFFAKKPQQFRPAFCVKAVAFFGNDIAGTEYRDSQDIVGTVPKIFDETMDFFKRNLHHTQQGQNFNSTGILEISEIALQELLQNALTHRDYSKNAPVRVLIFDNRIEIISPGCLPNSLTIENIKMGNAVVRNNLVVSYASKLMNYRGLGSGIARAIKNQNNIQFENDKDGEQFKVIIPRRA